MLDMNNYGNFIQCRTILNPEKKYILGVYQVLNFITINKHVTLNLLNNKTIIWHNWKKKLNVLMYLIDYVRIKSLLIGFFINIHIVDT